MGRMAWPTTFVRYNVFARPLPGIDFPVLVVALYQLSGVLSAVSSLSIQQSLMKLFLSLPSMFLL